MDFILLCMIDILGYKLKSQYILIGILLIGALIRFWGLGTSELFHDEGFYAFRAIGNLDYIQNDDQTTPIQWYKDATLPWWTNLSFHDHPKFYFLSSNLFFRIFGDSLFIARLPSALFGVLSVWLIYLLVKKISKNYLNGNSGELLSLLSAAALSVNHIHVWISRSALMESVQIFAILLNVWLFFIFLENRDKWFWFGLSLGACFSIKYTSIFLLPVYFMYLLVFEKKVFQERNLYLSLLIAFLLIIPPIVYNLYLYGAVGHFDLQLAFLLGQETPEWRASLGKILDPFSDFGINMTAMYSIPLLLLGAFGFLVNAGSLLSGSRKPLSFFTVIPVVAIISMLFFAGSAYRFLALLSPFLIILSVMMLLEIKNFIGEKEVSYFLLTAFFLYEVLFAIDGVFLTFPDFGVVKLDHYLEQSFDGKRSPAPPESSNPHLQKIIRENLRSYPVADAPFMVIYDENLALSARLWIFTRRIYYHGISAVTTGQFKSFLRVNGSDSLAGYKIYFVKTDPYTSLNTQFSTPDAAEFEFFLASQLNLAPVKRITGYQNLPMFDVYEFTM